MSTPRDAQELFDPDAHRPDGTEAFLDTPIRTNDPKALKAKALADKNKALRDENDLRAILATSAGIRFMVRLLERCGVDQAVFHPSNSWMCEIAGRRQVANDLRNWIKDISLETWFKVETEFETRRPKPKTSEKSGAA